LTPDGHIGGLSQKGYTDACARGEEDERVVKERARQVLSGDAKAARMIMHVIKSERPRPPGEVLGAVIRRRCTEVD